jgi:hypothetical protein
LLVENGSIMAMVFDVTNMLMWIIL